MNASRNDRLAFALIALFALTGVITTGLPALAQDTGEAAAEADAQMLPGMDAAAMAAWQEAMMPGDAHEKLSALVGEWAFTSTMWMAPDAPPMVSTGISKKQMIFGGRYLTEEITGSMMGQEFTGHGLIAFDNAKGEFAATWIDSMSTGLMTFVGEGDAETLTLTMHGDYFNPMTGENEAVRTVTQWVDEDHHTMDYFVTQAGGKEIKQMRIEYARKPGS